MTDQENDKIKRGDIIHLDYDLWIKEDDLLFDTTHKELADKHEITDENVKYEPKALIVDEGKAVAGLYKSLLSAEVGKEYEVEVPPEEGLGERDAKLVEWHMMNEIKRQKLEPVVGGEITIKDKSGRERTGIVTMISPRRVRVDYNSPLAGKTLRFKYIVSDKANTYEEKVSSILEIDFGRKDEFEIQISEDSVEIKLPDVCKYDQMWLLAKYKVVNDLREYGGFTKIRFIEEYLKKEKEDEAEEKEGEAKEEGPEGEAEKEETGGKPKEEEQEGEPEKEGEPTGESEEQEGTLEGKDGNTEGEEKEEESKEEEKEGE
jgi:FKBP-type peptidyl-prolyl cis-trans isomerase 2